MAHLYLFRCMECARAGVCVYTILYDLYTFVGIFLYPKRLLFSFSVPLPNQMVIPFWSIHKTHTHILTDRHISSIAGLIRFTTFHTEWMNWLEPLTVCLSVELRALVEFFGCLSFSFSLALSLSFYLCWKKKKKHKPYTHDWFIETIWGEKRQTRVSKRGRIRKHWNIKMANTL